MSKNTRILILLSLIFILPGLMGYVFFTNAHWLKQSTTNRGQFVPSPTQISNLPNTPTWHLILWYPSACASECLVQLDALRRLQLALGRHFYEVQLDLLQPELTPKPVPDILQHLMQSHIHHVALSESNPALSTALPQSSRVFIANRSHDLILFYTKPDDLKAIFSDIHHLLTQTNAST